MSFWGKIKTLFTGTPAPLAEKRATRLPQLSTRARLSREQNDGLVFGGAPQVIAPPLDAESEWRTLDLDSRTLDKISPADLLLLLVDLSPEVSRALFDFIRLFNPGYEVTAFRTANSTTPYKVAQTAIDDFLDTLKNLYGSTDVVLGRLIFGGFVRGAFLAELVLDQAGRLAVDLATPDPAAVRFRRVNDPIRGQIFELGQYQAGKWVGLKQPTISYIPIDPLPGSPYGRPLIAPALFSALFLLGLLHDLRRVVAQQGYPRIDISVDLAALAENMPESEGDDPKTFEAWVNQAIEQIKTMYASLEPDDAYIHSSVITVNRPVGTVDASSLGAVDALISGLERMATRALKTQTVLMAINDATTETMADLLWKIHIAGIRSIQHLLESQLERLLTVMLQAQGIQARVEWRFAELQVTAELLEAQVESLRIQNALIKRNQGWITQDEAATEVTGHTAVAEAPAPTLPETAGAAPAIGQRARSVPVPRTPGRGEAGQNGRH